ncbi:MAG: M48 family metalloprotease [Planctomycetales bacterium]|nr:M48 family metalloprotease [Planctomycetales bacterium]
MFLICALAVLCATALCSSPDQQPLPGDQWRLLATVAVVLAVGLLAKVISAWTIRSIISYQQRPELALQWFRRAVRVHECAWLSAAIFILFGVGWSQLVWSNWEWTELRIAGELLVLLPIVTPLFMSWCAWYELDCVLSGTPIRFTGLVRYLCHQARFYLGVAVAPVFLVVLWFDVTQGVVSLAGSAVARVWSDLVGLVLLVICYPAVLTLCWPTSPLRAGALRTTLLDFSREHGAGVREIYVWQSTNRSRNAAVCGVVPPFRYAFLTQALLDALSPTEIFAVFAHEVGHIRHGHVLRRILCLVTPLMIWFPVRPEWLFETGAPPVSWQLALLLSALVLHLATTFGAYARLLEYQADLWAWKQLMGRRQNAYDAWLEYVQTLQKLTPADASSRRGWLHPSTDQRVEFLMGCLRDSTFEARFNRRLGFVHVAMLLLIALSVARVCLVG